MTVEDIVKEYDLNNQCNHLAFMNGYGHGVYVELHAFHDEAVYLEGEFTGADLIKIAEALKIINKGVI